MLRVISLLLFVFIPLVHSMCPKGSFIDESNNDECTRCPIGTYNNRINAKDCVKCPGGGYTDYFGSKSRKDCRDCPPGMIIDSDVICETCDPGTYNPFVNGRKCLDCPKGTFSNTYNPSYCSPCRAGRVNNRKRASICPLCKGQVYQPQVGQKICVPCPKGTVTNPGGASCKPTCDPKKKRCKICPKGTEMDEDGKCVKCPEGTINAHPSVTKCQPCPDALMRPFIIPSVLVPNKARTRCICRPGEFLDLGEPFQPARLNAGCGKCPDGKSSNGVNCFE